MYNVVVLCDEEGSEFGFKFKPLIKLDNRTFIEHCLDKFIFYDNLIESYNFILTIEQEENNNFENFLALNFKNIEKKINVVKIFNNSEGPYQTLFTFLQLYPLKNLLVSNCCHSVNIERIIKEHCETTDIVISVRNIENEDQDIWDKIIIKNKKIQSFCGKEEWKTSNFGLIGCYFFKYSQIIEKKDYKYFYQFLEDNHAKYEIDIIEIKNAYFFGNPEMLKKTIEERRNLEMIIFDIDGIIFKHNDKTTTLINDNILIGNCVQEINNLYVEKMIVLMSSRPINKRKELINLLTHYGLKFHKLILGVNPGTSYLVKSIRPSNIFTRQSLSINLERDKGIEDLVFDENQNNKIEIIKTFREGTFNRTHLLSHVPSREPAHLFKGAISKEGFYFIRKSVVKRKENDAKSHYFILKRQSEDLKRINYYTGLTPKILKEYDDDYMYYYDLEYLKDYDNLDKYDDKIINEVLKKLINNFKVNLYLLQKLNKNDKFWPDFLDEKIYPRLDKYEKENTYFNHLINSNNVIINNKKYKGIRNILKNINFKDIKPRYLSPIHGNLRLENILFNDKNNDFKIIDTGYNNYLDFPGFDLGQLFHSLVSNFREWRLDYELFFEGSEEDIKCVSSYFSYDFEKIKYLLKLYSSILEYNLSKTKKIGVICMASYLILSLEMMKKISKETSIYALILAVVWLNNHGAS